MARTSKPWPAKNLLAQAASPYLRQHRHNPVHWRPWSGAALEEAQATNKPILLSIGYAACHWCHVMAHESFQNPDIAQHMNRLFVNIKVDREERPDIDDIYMRALTALGGQGGWPLTMFLTPTGVPFWGGTYFPPTGRGGQPGFVQVLENIATSFHEQQDKIQIATQELTARLKQQPFGGGTGHADLPIRAARQMAQYFDMERGGMTGAPKFPQFLMLDLLWRVGLAQDETACHKAAQISLIKLCQGGIYDHLGGGLCRYSVDADWLVPHFEKMLYDNALFLRQLTHGWRTTQLPLFAARADETVQWLVRDMALEGAFAASRDADSEGEEGKYYLWTQDEVTEALGKEASAFCAAYDITAQGNFEGRNILNNLHQTLDETQEAQSRFLKTRVRLLELRQQRIAPTLDDKLLADWNGLMIEALVKAAQSFGRPAWLALAKQAFASLLKHNAPKGELRHSWCRGQLGAELFAEDLGHMANAALTLYSATSDTTYLDYAERWVAQANAEFQDDHSGLYYMTPRHAPNLLVRPASCRDDVTPSASAALLCAQQQLYALTGQATYGATAERLYGALLASAEQAYPSMCASLAACHSHRRLTTAVLIGKSPELWTILWQASFADMLPLQTDGTIQYQAHVPTALEGKTQHHGRPTVYLCSGQACGPPITDSEQLRAALEKLPALL